MNTRDRLKRVVAEWSDYKIPEIYRRDFDETLLGGGEILSIIGSRRAGKTFLCYQIARELKKTLPSGNVLYINLEDERLHPMQGDELTLLWDVYHEMVSVDTDRRIILIIDEIQNAKNWSQWARRITDQNRNLKLIVTGSSSKLLSREIATELRGRTLSFTVYPLSFTEYLRAKNIFHDGKNLLYGTGRIAMKKEFNLYLKGGGFPATLQSGNPGELLKEYYKVMFYRDLIERYGIKNIRLFGDYMTLLIDQTASCFSISSTASKLAEFGHSFSKNTLSNFSRYAEEVFLIFEVKKYSYRVREQLRAARKLYAIDQGLVQAVRFSFSEDYGRMMENIAYLALRRRGENIYYHKGGKECDFIVTDGKKVVQAIQVVKSLSATKTREREFAGLQEAMKEHSLKEGIILTEDESETVKLDGATVKVLPLWYWLLLS